MRIDREPRRPAVPRPRRHRPSACRANDRGTNDHRPSDCRPNDHRPADHRPVRPRATYRHRGAICLGLAVAVCGYTASAAATARPAASAPTALSAPAAARLAGFTSAARPAVASATPYQLTPSELPADDAEQWSAVGGPSTRTLSGHAVGENECAKVAGADTWTQQGFSGADEQNIAVEDDFSFASPAAAHGAYTAFAPEMAGCQATSRALQSASHTASDAAVRQTASAPSALAWERTWTGVAGMSAPGAQTDHVYLAVHGAELVVLQFTEFPGKAPAYAVSGDSQVLALLAGEPGA